MPADLSSLVSGEFEIDSWINNFHWPVSLLSASIITLEIESGFQNIVEAETDDYAADVLTAGYKITTALASYVSNLSILKASKDQGINLRIGRESQNLYALSSNHPLPFTESNNWTTTTHQYSPTLKSLTRRLIRRRRRSKEETAHNAKLHAYGRNLCPSNRTPAYVLRNSIPTTSEYTYQTVDKLQLVQAAEWLPIRGVHPTIGEFSEHAGLLLEMTRDVASNHGVDISESIAKRIREILERHLDNTAALYRAFSLRVKPIAGKRLLMNSSGNQANRSLTVAAKRNNLEVTTFLHGNTIFSVYEHNRVNLDIAISNNYIVYTRGSIPRLQKIIRKFPPIKGNIPKFISTETTKFRSINSEFSNSPRNPHIKRVMIIEQGVSGDVASRFKPPDMIKTDLIIRVAKLLRENAYEVMLKRHPDNLLRGFSHDPYSPYMNICYDPFEEVMDETDAYVITYPTSSIFHHAVCSNKPIIYLDDGLYQWFHEPRELFARRARIVRLDTDDRNRLIYSDDELLEAFSQPAEDPDMSYAEQLLFPN